MILDYLSLVSFIAGQYSIGYFYLKEDGAFDKLAEHYL
jgi:hypothetical protein